jgi:hypothetical protein
MLADAYPGGAPDGESDPEKLADLAQGNARKKRTELVEALRGRIHHFPTLNS